MYIKYLFNIFKVSVLAANVTLNLYSQISLFFACFCLISPSGYTLWFLLPIKCRKMSCLLGFHFDYNCILFINKFNYLKHFSVLIQTNGKRVILNQRHAAPFAITCHHCQSPMQRHGEFQTRCDLRHQNKICSRHSTIAPMTLITSL